MKRFHLSVDEFGAQLRTHKGTMSEYNPKWKPEDSMQPIRMHQEYWERIARMAVELNPKTVLMVGGCLGTIPMMMRRLGYTGIITVLEPDEAIAAIGKAFGLNRKFTDVVLCRTLEKQVHDLEKGYATPQMSQDFIDGPLGYDLCILDAFDDEMGCVYPDQKAFVKKYGRHFKHIIANSGLGGRSDSWK